VCARESWKILLRGLQHNWKIFLYRQKLKNKKRCFIFHILSRQKSSSLSEVAFYLRRWKCVNLWGRIMNCKNWKKIRKPTWNAFRIKSVEKCEKSLSSWFHHFIKKPLPSKCKPRNEWIENNSNIPFKFSEKKNGNLNFSRSFCKFSWKIIIRNRI
jgi:hypothetical protein